MRGKNEKEGREIATEGVEWSKIQYSGACVAEYFSEIEIEDIEVYTLGDHFFEMWVSENGVSSLTSIKTVPVFIDPDCIKKKEE